MRLTLWFFGLAAAAAGVQLAGQHERRLENLRRIEEKMRANLMATARRPPLRDEGDSSDGDYDDRDYYARRPVDVMIVAPAAAELPAAAPLLEALELSPVRGARRTTNSIGVFVCDISTLLEDGEQQPANSPPVPATDADRFVMRWLENPNGGLIDGAPERLILSSLVAGNGELIMFGGLRKESMVNSATVSEVSNGLHFLTFRRGPL